MNGCLWKQVRLGATVGVLLFFTHAPIGGARGQSDLHEYEPHVPIPRGGQSLSDPQTRIDEYLRRGQPMSDEQRTTLAELIQKGQWLSDKQKKEVEELVRQRLGNRIPPETIRRVMESLLQGKKGFDLSDPRLQ